nr:alpha-galactosidase [Clostridiales bacterium]
FKKPKIKHLAGYTSWYNYFQKINEHIILRDLDGMDCASEEVNIFQIDDGYESAVGDWLIVDEQKFPNGMKYTADKIHEKGYKAGIWLAPLNAQKDSKILKEHQDWIIKDNETGKPLLGCLGWGGAYTFDIYNEEVKAYLKTVFDTYFDDWGYDMIKLDFLYSQCMQPRNGKTRGEIMCDAVDLLRELCGDHIILGCGVPLGACMGIFDACRIGPDENKVFEGPIYNKFGVNCELPSCQSGMNNAIFRNHLDGRAFVCDPDVFFLRDTNLTFNLEQKLLLGKINAICGNVLFVSDNAGDYGEDMVKYLREFLKEKDYHIDMAEYVSRDVIRLDFTEDGVKKTLKFNIKNGRSNIGQVI